MLDVTREWSTLSLAFIFSLLLLFFLTQIDWIKLNYRSIFPDHRGAGEWRSSNHGSAGALAMQWNHTNRKPLKCIWAWSLSCQPLVDPVVPFELTTNEWGKGVIKIISLSGILSPNFAPQPHQSIRVLSVGFPVGNTPPMLVSLQSNPWFLTPHGNCIGIELKRKKKKRTKLN